MSEQMERAAALILLPLMLVLINIDIALRTGQQSSLSWSHEALGLIMLFLFMLSLPNSAKHNELIRVDLLSRFLPPSVQAVTQQASHVFSALISGLLAYQCIIAGIDMYTFDDRVTTLSIPLWPLALCMSFLSLTWGVLHAYLLIRRISLKPLHD